MYTVIAKTWCLAKPRVNLRANVSISIMKSKMRIGVPAMAPRSIPLRMVWCY